MASRKSAPSRSAPSRGGSSGGSHSSAPSRSSGGSSGGSRSSPSRSAPSRASVAARSVSRPSLQVRGASRPSVSRSSGSQARSIPSSRGGSSGSRFSSSSKSSSSFRSAPHNQKTIGILGKSGPVTQRYGQPSQYDVFSGRRSPAHEIAVPVGTPVATPPGKWKVVQAFAGAKQRGYIGNFDGQGWGNNLRLQNTQTGEIIGFNHLSKVGVKPGQIIDGGTQVGATGESGNATGPHIALTYVDSHGRVGDFAHSPYGHYLFGGVEPGSGMDPGLLAAATQFINPSPNAHMGKQQMVRPLAMTKVPNQQIQTPQLPDSMQQSTDPSQVGRDNPQQSTEEQAPWRDIFSAVQARQQQYAPRPPAQINIGGFSPQPLTSSDQKRRDQNDDSGVPTDYDYFNQASGVS